MGVRLDELPPDLDPSLDHIVAAMKDGQTVHLTVEQIRAVIYATIEAELGDATRLLLNQVPIARGGTGQDTAAKAFDALWALGGDVAVNAGVLNLNGAQGAHAQITSSGNVTGITLTAGRHRQADVNTSFRITASATLIVNGLTSGTYQLRAGDRLFVQGYNGGVARVWTGRPLNQTGEVALFAHGNVPTGWIKANGALVSRTTFADLFAAVGTTWSAGDGATTFGIPDLRGEFVRGWDDARGVDVGRSLGSAQLDAFQSHLHLPPSTLYPASASISNGVGGGNGQYTVTAPSPQAPTSGPITDGAFGAPRVANETRGRNLALMYCIRY